MRSTDARLEGLQLYDEIIGVHTVLRRGADLGVAALARVAAGERADIATVVSTGRWFLDFTEHHHQNEERLLWPVLQEAYPDQAVLLDSFTREHQALARGFDVLRECLRMLEAMARAIGDPVPGPTARTALAVTEDLRVRLLQQLEDEEPVLESLLPSIAAPEIRRIRAAIVDGAPRTRPELVFGLLEDPEPTTGYEAVLLHFPPAVQRMRPLMLGKYRRRLARLGTGTSP